MDAALAETIPAEVAPMPVAHVIGPNGVNVSDPAEKAAIMIAGDRNLRETIGRPDRISPILHRWTIRHFPEEMMEDVRPADVSRTHKYSKIRNTP